MQESTIQTRAGEGVPPRTPRLPELLAPAGDWECARAAVENGADAIYFGLEKFNARMRARNFTEADLPALMEFLHRRGARGYVTFNTLVFADELEAARQYLESIIAAGVDAAIVQDAGICRLIRRLSDDFPIHASTQMTVTSPAGVAFARSLGCNLVVLARECSIREIEEIQRAGQTPNGPAMPLEVFVHGALCVAYSGQCLTSEALGGRSANRGECAQACRMPYELICDGQPVDLGDRRYLLSPQDLAGMDVLPDLVRAGVASLKIEGRLKSPEYVANITRVYRKALDRLAAEFEQPDGRGKADERPPAGGPQDLPAALNSGDRYDLEMAFSRGLYTGWFRGINNQELVHARFGKKRGVYLGRVQSVLRTGVQVALEGPVKPGDGVVFDAGRPDQHEEGGRVYEVHPDRQQTSARSHDGSKSTRPESLDELVELRFGWRDVDLNKVRVGDRIWKTSDPELDRRLRSSFEGDRPRHRRPIHMEVHGCEGAPLTMLARDDDGHAVRVESDMTLTPATKQPLTLESLRAQLDRLGGTAFRLGRIECHLEGRLLLPVSELNRMRREAVRLLEIERARPVRWDLKPRVSTEIASERGANPGQAGLAVLVRSMEHLEAALECGVGRVYCEFEDPKRYAAAVGRVREHAGSDRTEVFVAPPRIFKTGEEWILRQVRASNADGYLVRNYDHLGFFEHSRRIGDFSLNVANALAAEYFMEQRGLERVTASYDLNIGQLEALLRSAPPAWFEITIHQHMPMFHMEHCVFCAFLSTGRDYRDCGRPCDRHQVRLRDRVGAEHVLKADAGCRNTLFQSRAQTGAEFVGCLMRLGARRFRIELLGETREEARRTIRMYQQLLRGEMEGGRLWRELKLMNQLGVTRGQLPGANEFKGWPGVASNPPTGDRETIRDGL